MDLSRLAAAHRVLARTPSRRGLGSAILGLLAARETASQPPVQARSCPPCRKRKQGKCKKKRPDGTPCGSGLTCQAGQCRPLTCTAGTQNCGGTCVDLATDPRNCGACGTRCQLNGVCRAGTCDCALASCAGIPGATCCNTGLGGCICENAGTGFWAAPTNCGVFVSCPADTTPCTGPSCRACCPAGSTCDPGTGTCLQ